jgi:hypothetical protein
LFLPLFLYIHKKGRLSFLSLSPDCINTLNTPASIEVKWFYFFQIVNEQQLSWAIKEEKKVDQQH